MKLITLLIPLLFYVHPKEAEVFQKKFEQEFKRSTSEFFFGENDRQFYLDQEGQFTLINTPNFLNVYDREGNLVIERDHIKKSSKFLSNLAKEATSFSLKEGSSFIILGSSEVALVLDYTVDENLLIAYDLKTGEEIWRHSDLRYTSSKEEQMASMIQNVMIRKAGRQLNNQLAMASVDNPVFASVTFETSEVTNPGGVVAKSYVLPLEGSEDFILKAGEELICLGIADGEIKWRYNKRDIIPAWHQRVLTDKLIIIGYSESTFSQNDRDLILIDLKTGNEVWHNQYLTNFVSDRSFVTGENLILDYYGMEAYDLRTGELLISSLGQGTINASNVITGGLLSGDDESAEMVVIPSFVGSDKDYIYTYHRMSMNNKYGYQGAAKPIITKYNTGTGKAIWETEKLPTQSEIINETASSLIVKMPKGLNGFYLGLIDKETGELTRQTDKLKDYFFGSGTGISFSENKIYVGLKDGLILYNKNDLRKLNEISTKSSSIGNLQTMDFYQDDIFFIGDKGVALYDESGDLLTENEVKKVESAVWNEKAIILFTKKETVAVPLVNPDSKDVLEITPIDEETNIMFSNNANYMVAIQDEKIISNYRVSVSD